MKDTRLKSLMTHHKKDIARWFLDLIDKQRDELIRYKIWENIFGYEFDTVEEKIDAYLTKVK